MSSCDMSSLLLEDRCALVRVAAVRARSDEQARDSGVACAALGRACGGVRVALAPASVVAYEGDALELEAE